MVNIFLDSNILFNNPFMDSGQNQYFINKISQLGGYMYITDIVLKETLHNYEKNLKEINKDIDKVLKGLKRNHVSISSVGEIKTLDINKEKLILESSIYDLIQENKLILLDTKNEFLEETVNRSINRIKPFTENKVEFRDCLIWLTYAEYIKEKSLDNCCFITNNFKDFCDEKMQLHTDLENDISGIRIYKSVKEFFSSELKVIEDITLGNLEKEFGRKKIDIYDLYEGDFGNIIQDECEEFITNNSAVISKYLNNNTYSGCVINELDVVEVIETSKDFDVLNKCGNIFGTIKVICNISLINYAGNIKITNESAYLMIAADFYAKKTVNQTKKNEKNLDIYEYELDNISEIEIQDIRLENISEDYLGDYLYEKRKDLEDTAYADMMDAYEEYYKH